MTDEQLVTQYLKAAHELSMMPLPYQRTPEKDARCEALEAQIAEMRPQIDGLHLKYERRTNESKRNL